MAGFNMASQNSTAQLAPPTKYIFTQFKMAVLSPKSGIYV